MLKINKLSKKLSFSLVRILSVATRVGTVTAYDNCRGLSCFDKLLSVFLAILSDNRLVFIIACLPTTACSLFTFPDEQSALAGDV